MQFPAELSRGPVRLPVRLLCEKSWPNYALGYRLCAHLRPRTADRISDDGRQ